MKRYKVKYKVQVGDFTAPRGGAKAGDGVRVSKDDHGYTDELFLASVVYDKDGSSSILLLSTESGGRPSLSMLRKIKHVIEAELSDREHHSP